MGNNVEYYGLENVVYRKAKQRNKKSSAFARLIYWKDEFLQRAKTNYHRYCIKNFGKEKSALEYQQQVYKSNGYNADIPEYGRTQNGHLQNHEPVIADRSKAVENNELEELPLIDMNESDIHPNIDLGEDLRESENLGAIKNNLPINEAFSNDGNSITRSASLEAGSTNTINVGSIEEQMKTIQNGVLNNLNKGLGEIITFFNQTLSAQMSENQRLNNIIKDKNAQIVTITAQYKEQQGVAQDFMNKNQDLIQQNNSLKEQLAQTDEKLNTSKQQYQDLSGKYVDLQAKVAPLIKTLEQSLNVSNGNIVQQETPIYKKAA